MHDHWTLTPWLAKCEVTNLSILVFILGKFSRDKKVNMYITNDSFEKKGSKLPYFKENKMKLS